MARRAREPHADALACARDDRQRSLPALLEATDAAVRREQPELARRLDPTLLRHGIDATNRRFVALLRGEPDPAARQAQQVALGAAAARAGVAVEALNAGYRVGARVGRQLTARHERALGLDVTAVLGLAEAWLGFVDRLAADSLEGYEREAAALRGVRARERQVLLERLLAGTPAAAAAGAAGWRGDPLRCDDPRASEPSAHIHSRRLHWRDGSGPRL